jgi:protein-disulfide isomerase
VRIVWKNYPLDIHKDAPLAHVAAMAANEQGRFWDYHDKLFANQTKIKRDDLFQYARDLGLDIKRFEHSLEVEQAKPLIAADTAEAKALGITGTPAFFVNGRYLSGAKPFDEFAQLINGELTRLKLPVPAPPIKPSAKAGG